MVRDDPFHPRRCRLNLFERRKDIFTNLPGGAVAEVKDGGVGLGGAGEMDFDLEGGGA